MRKTFQVLHCEPSTVEFAYKLFPVVVEVANSFGVILNIQMHPNWMKFAVDNKDSNSLFNDMSRAFIEQGHIPGIHHHGLNHPTNWDGYTNVSYNQIPEDKKNKYIGTMKDLEKLIVPFESALGRQLDMGSMTDENIDFITRYKYSTNGILPYEGLSKPKIKVYNEIHTIQIGHGFPANDKKYAQARNIFLSDKEGVYGCIFHLENWSTLSNLIQDWWKFIATNGEIVDIYTASNLNS